MAFPAIEAELFLHKYYPAKALADISQASATDPKNAYYLPAFAKGVLSELSQAAFLDKTPG